MTAVSRVLTIFGTHKLGVLRTVCFYVFAPTLRFSAHGFLALTRNAWFLQMRDQTHPRENDESVVGNIDFQPEDSLSGG